ncbi:MAG: TIGR02266 family protein [Myxococcota bacterium]
MNNRELTDQEIVQAEEQASRAEAELREAITESEADAAEVAYTLRELRMRVEEEIRRGLPNLEGVLDDLNRASAPVVPLDRHHARLIEARADAVRARMWVVAGMQDDLKRFGFELADAVQTAEAAREALQKSVETPRVNMTRRFERIRAVTADLIAKQRIANPPTPRRQRPRVRLQAAIDLHSASNFFRGFSENISDGGVFIATEEQLPVGTEVDIAFTLPDGVEIRGRGVVRWARGAGPDSAAGLGVQFINLSGAASDAVQNFLTMREPLFHPE